MYVSAMGAKDINEADGHPGRENSKLSQLFSERGFWRITVLTPIRRYWTYILMGILAGFMVNGLERAFHLWFDYQDLAYHYRFGLSFVIITFGLSISRSYVATYLASISFFSFFFLRTLKASRKKPRPDGETREAPLSAVYPSLTFGMAMLLTSFFWGLMRVLKTRGPAKTMRVAFAILNDPFLSERCALSIWQLGTLSLVLSWFTLPYLIRRERPSWEQVLVVFLCTATLPIISSLLQVYVLPTRDYLSQLLELLVVMIFVAATIFDIGVLREGGLKNRNVLKLRKGTSGRE